MGGHYGSIQFRTDDRDRVRDAAETVARERSIRCLVGPARNGWVGVYPQGGGQGDGFGAALASCIGGHAIQLLVYDDSVLAYWLYEDGVLVDRYWSAPGYFNDRETAAEEPLTGDVERFAFALAAAKRETLRGLIARDAGPTFEYERLERLAKLLGISNAVTSYEYLKGGENEGIRGRRQFVEVPATAVQAERAKRTAERKRVKSEWKRSVDSGRLLVRDERSEYQAFGCAVDDGFVVTWSDVRYDRATVESYRPPWTAPTPIIALPERVHATDAVVEGRRLAISCGDCVRVFDHDDAGIWQQVAEVREDDMSLAVTLSRDGSRLAYSSRKAVHLSVIATGDRHLNMGQSRTLQFTPDGNHVALARHALHFVRVENGEVVRTLYIGGKPPDESEPVKGPPPTIDGLTPAEYLADMFAKAVKLLERKLAASTKQNADAFELSNVQTALAQVSAQAEATRVRVLEERAGTPRAPRPMVVRSLEQVSDFGWTRDGRYFWCGTDFGLRVFDAEAIASLPEGSTPIPVMSAELPKPHSKRLAGRVLAAVEAHGRLIFAGRGRYVCHLDLATRIVRPLIDFPEESQVIGLTATSDGTSLGVSTFYQSDRHSPYRSSWQI